MFAVVVSAAGAARPSLWFDEAATISAAHNRSITELWRMLSNIDAVHGLYYLVMHGWFSIVPATEFWSRLSSSFAVGVAAAGVVVLARQAAGRTAAVASGVIFAILPRVTWAGIEARSYALSAAAAVWLTLLVLTAARRDWRWQWLLYALALLVASLLNLFVGLMVLVYAVAVPLFAQKRATALWWAGASALAALAAAPFALLAEGQIAQVNWISAPGLHTISDILLVQYFDHSVPFAVIAGVVLATALVSRRQLGHRRRLTVVAWVWIIAPTLALLTYSIVRHPVYYPRYLCFTSPAVALLLGTGTDVLARTRESVTALVAALALAATPNYFHGQRGPYSKEGMDYSQIADVIDAHAKPGDCLILDNTTTWKPGPIRPITAARPSTYGKLADPGRGMRAADRNRLWDGHVAIWSVIDRVRKCTVLWTVSQRDDSRPDYERGFGLDPGPRLGHAPAYRFPERLGFHVMERWQFSFAQVAKLTR